MSATAVAAPLVYPQAERGPVVETQFGEAVADPYRWLENDVRTDPKVKAWVDAEKCRHAHLSRRAAWSRRDRSAAQAAVGL